MSVWRFENAASVQGMPAFSLARLQPPPTSVAVGSLFRWIATKPSFLKTRRTEKVAECRKSTTLAAVGSFGAETLTIKAGGFGRKVSQLWPARLDDRCSGLDYSVVRIGTGSNANLALFASAT